MNPNPTPTAGEHNSGMLPRVLTVEEAAKILRISRGSAFAAVRTGELPHVRIGRRILVPAHRLTELLGDPAPTNNQESQPVPASPTADREQPPGTQTASALRELAATLEDLIAAREAATRRGAGR